MPETKTTSRPEVSQHAFEVRISIGGNDWGYVIRTLRELASHVEDHGPECSLCSGGWHGSHSIHIKSRDVTTDQFRNELEAWRQADQQYRDVLSRAAKAVVR
jgi:hypothetical protein